MESIEVKVVILGDSGFKNIKVSEKHLYYIDLQGIFLMIMLFLLLARLLWQKILLIKIKI